MKTRMLFALIFVISACGSIAAQTSTDLQQVTLYYFYGHPSDASRAAINFETGKRGQSRGGPSDEFDLKYGSLIIEKDGKFFPDWLSVADPRSMIVELGEKQWQDIKKTPPFPKAKRSLPPLSLSDRPIVIDVSADSKEVSPYRQVIVVKPGHMYLMRLVHGRKVIYTMFRVENLTSRASCVLSWKQVTPPNVDNEK